MGKLLSRRKIHISGQQDPLCLVNGETNLDPQRSSHGLGVLTRKIWSSSESKCFSGCQFMIGPRVWEDKVSWMSLALQSACVVSIYFSNEFSWHFPSGTLLLKQTWQRLCLQVQQRRNEMNSYVQYESQYWFGLGMTLRMSESNGNLINPHNLAPASRRGENLVWLYCPVSLVNSQERAVKEQEYLSQLFGHLLMNLRQKTTWKGFIYIKWNQGEKAQIGGENCYQSFVHLSFTGHLLCAKHYSGHCEWKG